MSDKHLTHESGLLKKLLPGNILLPDRGFAMRSLLSQKACLNSLLLTEKTRKLANLRMHIKQVIGATRHHFSILSLTLPIQYMKSSCDDIPVVDKIIRICSALNNLCVSAVPFT